ncbi:AraC family transcriptional regulator [Alteribacillus sp. HJP-4]|uniref:AraC family transcriptional regulator n=1 Tax=Alteribacillus sp. HJP-4 TaxID=2775394 RepID=UPI0035CD341E
MSLKNYGFNFQNSSNPTNLLVAGREKQTSVSYDWNGLTRQDIGSYLFQYTISGNGVLEMNKKKYQLSAGRAFLVEIPSDHRYYLPSKSSHWEFVFIILGGEYTRSCWSDILQLNGPVMDVPPDAKVIQSLFTIYDETSTGRITDSYYASAKAYEFIMECYRFVKKIDKKVDLPPHMSKAITYLHASYQKPVTVEELAELAELSRGYFIKQFQEFFHLTPKQYITRLRIQYAVELLQNTDLPVKTIALKTGFSDDNYFYKVFRKMIGISPGKFRNSEDRITVNHIII